MSTTEEIKSTRLDLSQMPRDPDGSLGALRITLVKLFNYTRNYPRKMAALKAVLKYTYTRIVEFEKQVAVQEEAQKVKALEDAKAAELAAAEKAEADALALAEAAKQAESQAGEGSAAPTDGSDQSTQQAS